MRGGTARAGRKASRPTDNKEAANNQEAINAELTTNDRNNDDDDDDDDDEKAGRRPGRWTLG